MCVLDLRGDSPLRQVGRAKPRADAAAKAAGAVRYAGDFTLPGMAHGIVVRSRVACGRLRRVDVSRARALRGVLCVLTAEDVAGCRLGDGQSVLAGERIRHHGEAIALIAAETPAIAERALDVIDVEIEETPGVFDPLEALQPGAPVVHGNDNVVDRRYLSRGDLEVGFATADVVVENRYRTGLMEHAFLEPESGTAWIDGNGVIHIRVGTQTVEHFRSVAIALGLPHDGVRVHGMYTGGAFGGKESITVEIFLALLARSVSRPVRVACTREQSFFTHGKRHRVFLDYRTGFTRDGRITVQQVRITADAGASSKISRLLLFHACSAACGPYRVDNARVEAVAVATNNLPTEALRGFGAGIMCIGYEAQMDEAARALHMDPRDVRRFNFLSRGDANATGQVIESAVWTEACMDRAWEALGERSLGQGPVKVGRGVACYHQFYGRITSSPENAEASVGVDAQGGVLVRCCVPDIGGGQVSALRQIAAEVLAVSMDDVMVRHTDSATLPLAGPTGVSGQLYMSGNAVSGAAAALRVRLLGEAAARLGMGVERLIVKRSQVMPADDPGRALTFGALVAQCTAGGLPYEEHYVFRAPVFDVVDRETGQGKPYPDFTFGAHAVEVAVDVETGEVSVLKSVGCHDVGRAINPAAVAGQIQGGAVMGLGCALSEEIRLVDGRLVTPSLSEYLIPTAMDVPPVNRAIILESGSGLGPFGAKGVGEAGFTPVAPAIASAVAEAIGARVYDLPATPERIVMRLGQSDSGPPW